MFSIVSLRTDPLYKRKHFSVQAQGHTWHCRVPGQHWVCPAQLGVLACSPCQSTGTGAESLQKDSAQPGTTPDPTHFQGLLEKEKMSWLTIPSTGDGLNSA